MRRPHHRTNLHPSSPTNSLAVKSMPQSLMTRNKLTSWECTWWRIGFFDILGTSSRQWTQQPNHSLDAKIEICFLRIDAPAGDAVMQLVEDILSSIPREAYKKKIINKSHHRIFLSSMFSCERIVLIGVTTNLMHTLYPLKSGVDYNQICHNSEQKEWDGSHQQLFDLLLEWAWYYELQSLQEKDCIREWTWCCPVEFHAFGDKTLHQCKPGCWTGALELV